MKELIVPYSTVGERMCTNHFHRVVPGPLGGTNTSQSQGHTSLHYDNGTDGYRPAHRFPVDKL